MNQDTLWREFRNRELPDGYRQEAGRRLMEWLYRGGDPPLGWTNAEVTLDAMAAIRDDKGWEPQPMSIVLTLEEQRIVAAALRRHREEPRVASLYIKMKNHTRSTRNLLSRERARSLAAKH